MQHGRDYLLARIDTKFMSRAQICDWFVATETAKAERPAQDMRKRRVKRLNADNSSRERLSPAAIDCLSGLYNHRMNLP